jgi:hypothetical protein
MYLHILKQEYDKNGNCHLAAFLLEIYQTLVRNAKLASELG